jgi:hypothetical protein
MNTTGAVLLAYGVAALTTPLPASAALTSFTNQGSFTTAAGSPTLQDFNSIAPFSLATPAAPSFSTSLPAFTLSGNGNGDFVAVAAGTRPGNINGTNFLLWGQQDPVTGASAGNGNAGPQFTFTFSSPLTAFGFDWNDTDFTDSYKITIDGTDFTNPPFTPNETGSGFFGVVATGGETFTSVTFTQTQATGFIDPFGLDNLRVSAAPSGRVPEPASLSLLATALLAGAGAFKRRRRQA